jgi:glycosyltransferase involved in cell wall biosynthesis
MRKNLNVSSIVIVGLARNCEKTIVKEIKQINSSFQKAKNIKWIIVESDSNDDTINKINKLSKKYSIKLISLGNLIDHIPKRTARIAHCRNVYLNELKNNAEYKYSDFVVIVDLDGVNSIVNQKSIESCWKLKINWDACFPNQLAPYYDIWALRHNLWCAADCFEEATFLTKHSKGQSFNEIVSRKMIQLSVDAQVIEVDSAFGGMGIYKIECLKNSEYKGLTSDGKEFCEHVYFHRKLREQNKTLVINPAFINGVWNNHNKHLQFFQKFKRKLLLPIKLFIDAYRR